jgi:hypothetical protein
MGLKTADALCPVWLDTGNRPLGAQFGVASGQPAPADGQPHNLQRLRRLDQCQQPSGSHRSGAISEQMFHQALLPELFTYGAGGNWSMLGF